MKFIKKWLPYLTISLFVVIVWWILSKQTIPKDSILNTLAAGVVSGLVTAILLYVFNVFRIRHFHPWIENLLYKDARIEGVWSGFIVPYIGLDEIDRLNRQAAWHAFKESKLHKENKANTRPIEASVEDERGTNKKVNAELILHGEIDVENKEDKGDAKRKPINVTISIKPAPIMIRAEIFRVGHNVSGRVIEIGGASKIHTYCLDGSFRNLILAGKYENERQSNIDRGSFSLMLRNNGNRLEGFFSAYGDSQNKIVPMMCILKKQNENMENQSI